VVVTVDKVAEEDEADDGGDDADEAEEEDECNCVHFSTVEGQGF